MNAKFLFLVTLILLSFFSASSFSGISSIDKICEDQYEDAWMNCNIKYNGKCNYLGGKHIPSCIIGENDSTSNIVDSIYQCEDTNQDGFCDRVRVIGDRCPPYSSSTRPDSGGYCYPD